MLAALPLGVALWRGYHFLQGTPGPMFEGQLGNFWWIIGGGMFALAMAFAQYPKMGNAARLGGILLANAVAYGFLVFHLLTAEKSPSLADATTWKELAIADGPFKVLLPGAPKRKTASRGYGDERTMEFAFTVDRKPEREIFIVSYNDVPPKLLSEGAEKILNEVGNTIVQDFADKKTPPKVSAITLEGVPGREVIVAGDKLTVRARFYIAKQRAFGLIAGGPPGASTDTAAAKFFDSFKITGPIPEPEKEEKKEPDPPDQDKKDTDKKDTDKKDTDKKDTDKKDADKKEAKEPEKEEPFKGHKGNHLSMDLSEDGGLLATGAEDKAVIVWNVEDGKKLALLDAHKEPIRRLRFLPGGKHLVSAGDRTIVIWDLEKKTPLKTWPTDGKEVVALDTSRDGKWLAIAAGDTLFVWSTDKWTEAAAVKGASLNSAVFAPDNKTLYSGRNGEEVHILDLTTRKSRPGWKIPERGSQKLVLSPDGLHLINVHGKNNLFDTATGTARTDAQVPGSTHHMAFSRDGKKLVVHDNNNEFKVYEFPALKEIGPMLIPAARQMLFHPDGRLVVLTPSEVRFLPVK